MYDFLLVSAGRSFDFFHIAITSPNIEQLANRTAESGGRQHSKIWDLMDGKPYKIVFCEDPFGNVIEIYSHEFKQVWDSSKSEKIIRSTRKEHRKL
jgi:catechol-2,3-dioxygenase